MTPEEIFLNRYDQMQILCLGKGHLDMIDLSAKIRQMMFDKHSLVETVNKNKIPTIFTVSRMTELPTQVDYQILRLIDPIGKDTKNHVELTRNQFGQHVVGRVKDTKITIKDVISYGANVAGGVHHNSNPTKMEHRAAKTLADFVSINGMPLLIEQIHSIGTATLRGLYQLRTHVYESKS